jgi:hypothetical protein
MGYGEPSDVHELKNALRGCLCGLKSRKDQHDTMKQFEKKNEKP